MSEPLPGTPKVWIQLARKRPLTIRALLPAVLITAAWLVGLLLWGRPESGFGDTSATFFHFVLVLITGPVFVLGALMVGATNNPRSVAGMLSVTAWLGGLIGTAYIAFMTHFGGFCLDADDACTVTWSSRLISLTIALGIVLVGATAETMSRDWQLRRTESDRGRSG